MSRILNTANDGCGSHVTGQAMVACYLNLIVRELAVIERLQGNTDSASLMAIQTAWTAIERYEARIERLNEVTR